MLVVLSDLHLSEAQTSRIGSLTFNQNLPAETYRAYLAEINQMAVANQIKQVDFVLAGDIFEVSRSGIWLTGDERPYQDNDQIKSGSATEAVILKVLSSIAEEDKVGETLRLFQNIQNYFEVEIRLHFLLGNHDRLLNATPQIRKYVREILGLAGAGVPFDHQYIFRRSDRSPFCLVRHGHEYDPMNFSVNTHELDIIPTDFSEDVYGKAPLGDFITIEYGAAIPHYFLEMYGEKRILSDPVLLALYERLMGFDDVRPATALLAFLFSTPGVSKRETWSYMQPCFERVLKNLSNISQFEEGIIHTTALKKSQRLMLRGLLGLDIVDQGVPYWMIRQLMKRVSKSIKLKSQAIWAKKEALILDQNSGCECVISGHSHFPEVTLISAKNNKQKYYINSGTWRNMIPATKNFKEFGKLKGLTKVIVFKPLEKATPEPQTNWSFHYLSGVSYGDHRHL